MDVKIGERAGAVLSAGDGVIKVIGFGTYEGKHVPEEAVGFMAEALRDIGRGNPRIRLDSGSVVYGCECWWGPEKDTQRMIAKYETVETVDIDEIRAEYLRTREQNGS